MICLDASVAAKWFFREDHSDRATALLQTALTNKEPIVAPPLLPSEVANILRQRMRAGTLTLPEAQTILAQFLSVPIALHAPETLYDSALILADRYNLPAIYDAHYLAIADLTGSTLWTADQRLLNTLSGHVPFVHGIATYQLPEETEGS